MPTGFEKRKVTIQMFKERFKNSFFKNYGPIFIIKIMKPPEKRTNFDFEFLVVNKSEFEEKPNLEI